MESLSYGFNPYKSWANLLKNVQTYSQIAQELIQNADDAGATEIVFRFFETHLTISNDSSITSCSNYNSRDSEDCLRDVPNLKNSFCDLHAIRNISSQNKLENPDVTGKMGIGLISLYKITDAIAFRTDTFDLIWNTKLKNWDYFSRDEDSPLDQLAPATNRNTKIGTEIFAEYSKMPKTEVRTALGLKELDGKDIQSIITEFIDASTHSLLFSRNLRKISLFKGETCLLKLESNYLGATFSELQIRDALENEEQIYFSYREPDSKLSHLISTDSTSGSKSEREFNSESRLSELKVEQVSYSILLPQPSAYPYQ